MKREKKMKKNVQNLREVWATIKCTNICIIGVAIKRRERDRKKKISKQ